MKLGKRIILALVSAGGVMVLLTALVIHFVVLDSYTKIEEDAAFQAVTRVKALIHDRCVRLGEIAADWSNWDDAYEFMRSRNPEFIKSALNQESIDGLRLDALLFYGERGDIVFEYYRDSAYSGGSLRSEYKRALSGTHRLFNPSATGDNFGLVTLRGEVMVVAAQPVRDSERKLPPRGVLIFGYILDRKAKNNLSELSGADLDFTVLDGGGLSPEISGVRDRLSIGERTALTASNDRLYVYTLVNDVAGKPGLLVGIGLDRDIIRTGRDFSVWLTAIFSAMIVACAALVLFLARREILAPLQHVRGNVAGLGREDAPAIRSDIPGAAEWQALMNEINGALARQDASWQVLVRKDEFFRGMVEHLPVGLCRRTPGVEGRIVQVNAAFLRMFGFHTAEEALGFPVRSLYHNPDDAGSFSRIMRSGSDFAQVESKLRRMDGRILWGAVTGRIIKDSEGEVAFYDCVIQDVTQRRLAEDAMRESERRYRMLVDHSFEAIAVMQGERMVFISPRMADIFEWSMHELLDKSPLDLVHPDDQHIVLERLGAQIRGVPTTPVYSVRMVTATGVIKWIQLSTNLIEWDGHPSILMFLTDVTENKRTEDALRLNREKFKVLFDVFPLGVMVTDFHGDVVEANEIGLRILGITHPNECGRKIREGVWKVIRLDGTDWPVESFPLERAANGEGSVDNLEFGLVKEDGSVTWLMASSAPIPVEGIGAGIVFSDISEHKAADAAMEESERRYRGLIESFPTAVALLQHGKVIYVNSATLRTFGADSPEELWGTDVLSWVAESERERILEYMTRRLRSGDNDLPIHYESAFRRRNGEEFPAEVYVRTVDYKGVPARQVIIFDISERKRAEAMLLTQKAYFQQLFENSPEGIVICDTHANIISVNRSFREMFGFAEAEALGRNIDELVVPDGFLPEALKLTRSALRGEVHRQEGLRKRSDGSTFDASVLTFPIRPGSGQDGFYISYADITERKRNEKFIEYLAHHDSLTGLPNRLLLDDRIRQAMIRAERFHTMVGIMFIDLDSFKDVNDTYGHRTGDEVLIATSRRITACLREMDTVARTGGDEFVIVIQDAADLAAVKHVAAKIIDVICQPHDLGEEKAVIGASVGLSLYPNDANEIESLLAAADKAMYAAKARGKNVCVYIGES